MKMIKLPKDWMIAIQTRKYFHLEIQKAEKVRVYHVGWLIISVFKIGHLI
jgi:hypothetical protein